MLNGDKEENELPGKGQLNDDIELVEKHDDEQSNAHMQSNAFAHRYANILKNWNDIIWNKIGIICDSIVIFDNLHLNRRKKNANHNTK